MRKPYRRPRILASRSTQGRRVYTPLAVYLHCPCGASASFTRRQNAMGRTAKEGKWWRTHPCRYREISGIGGR